MPAPYSLDLRLRVVAAVDSGRSCRAVAEQFDIAVSTVVKWTQRARAHGSPAAGKMGGHRPYLLVSERIWILERIAAKPDLTVRALLVELADRGVRVARDTLWRFLTREGLSFKKNLVRERAIAARRHAATQALAQASAQD